MRATLKPWDRRLVVGVAAMLATVVIMAMSAVAAQANPAQASGKTPAADCAGSVSSGLKAGTTGQCPSSLSQYLVTEPNIPSGLVTFEQTAGGIALGLMAAIATIDVLLKFLVGFGRGAGAGEVVEGMAKSAFGVVLVVMYPWLYTQGMSLATQVSGALLGNASGGVWLQGVGSLSGGSIIGLLSSDPVSWLMNVLILIITLFALVGVIMMKIGISATALFLYGAGPMVIALWPLQGVRWITEMASKALVACLMVPLVWALLVKVFTVVDSTTVTQALPGVMQANGAANFPQKILAIALLYALIAIPKSLLREGTSSGGGGGIVKQMVSFAAGTMASHAAGQVVSRTLDRLRGPQATVTYNHLGEVSGYSVSKSTRGREGAAARRALSEDFTPMAESGTWREADETPGGFERRLAANRRDSNPVTRREQLDPHVDGLSPAARNGVTSAYRRHVTAPGEDGRPKRDYDRFWNAMADAAADERLPESQRGAYRALAATTNREMLYQRFGERPPSPSESGAGAPGSGAAPGRGLRPGARQPAGSGGTSTGEDDATATPPAAAPSRGSVRRQRQLERRVSRLGPAEQVDLRQEFNWHSAAAEGGASSFRRAMSGRARRSRERPTKRAYEALAGASDQALSELFAEQGDAA